MPVPRVLCPMRRRRCCPCAEPLRDRRIGPFGRCLGVGRRPVLRGRRRLGDLDQRPGGRKIYFDSCSQHHAWRARLWEERRPGLPRSPSSPTTARAGRLSLVSPPWTDDVERLSAYCRVVLPRLVVGYRSWQRRCSAASDQPVARALGFALADVLGDWERGCGLLEGYLDGRGRRARRRGGRGATARDLDRLLARNMACGRAAPPA